MEIFVRIPGKYSVKTLLFSVVVPHWFQCGSGSSFYLSTDKDPDPVSQTDADSVLDPRTFIRSQKVNILMKNTVYLI
jgi:hypothetical protein